MVKYLLSKGADPNYINEERTPMDLAFAKNKLEVVEFLRELTNKKINRNEYKDSL